MRQTFQQQEAEQILQEAVRREVHETSGADTETITAVSHERLLAMAEELGISPAALDAVLRDRQAQTELERAQANLAQLRQEFITGRRAEFMPHFYAFAGVNLFLLIVNLLTSPGYLWFIWPLLSWGLGLYFHAVASLPTRGPTFEQAFTGWRERRVKRQEKEARKQGDEAIRTRKTTARSAAEAELDE